MTNKYVTGVLEEERENESEAIIKLTNYFLKGNMESRRQWGIIIVCQNAEENNYLPTFLYPAKIFFMNESKINIFSDK